MSNPGSSRHGPYRKPQADIYTVLLAVALVAILVGCVFLYLEVAGYPDKPPWSGTQTAWLDRGAAGGQETSPAGVFDSDRFRPVRMA